QQLMDACRAQRPDLVLCTRLSRFMRNARLTLNAVHELRQLGVALVCKDEPIDTRQKGIGDLFLAILGTIAEWEAERLGEYARDTRRNLIAKGRWPGGKAPYGYEWDKSSGHMTVVDDQAEVVRLIFALYTQHRVGMGVIKRKLAERGIPSPRGRPLWGEAIIMGILGNKVYTGKHALGITVPSIVSQDTFDRAQYLRSANTGFHPPRKDSWPLQNRLRCRECGSPFRCFYSHGRRWYRCTGRTSASRHYLQTGSKCSSPGLRAEVLELTLYRSLMDAVANPPAFLHLLNASIDRLRARVADLERDAGPLYEGRKRATDTLERIERAWLNRILDESELSLRKAKAVEELEYYESRLGALDQGHLKDLENTRAVLNIIEKAIKEARSGDPSKSRLRSLLDAALWPHLPEEGFNSEFELEIDQAGVAHALGELLNRLQAECYYAPEGVDVQGIINVNVPIECQASCSPS
ncbi:MAG: recombinase family protein, partial [Chloroflexi bacterium]|nr:recombinase family protein [Chloroflexota bacterium]